MMSGCGILTNGKGTRREYCEFSLDELQVRAGPFQRSPGTLFLPGGHIVVSDLTRNPLSLLEVRSFFFFFFLSF